jgi:hypothetical protein
VADNLTRAVTRLLAAADAHAAAIETGQGPSRQQEFLAAVAAYRSARPSWVAARDRFMAQYPSGAALDQAYRDRRPSVDIYAAPHGTAMRLIPDHEALIRHAEWAARNGHTNAWVTPGGSIACQRHIDGCPVVDPEAMPDGDLCPCGPVAYRSCPIHWPGQNA